MLYTITSQGWETKHFLNLREVNIPLGTTINYGNVFKHSNSCHCCRTYRKILMIVPVDYRFLVIFCNSQKFLKLGYGDFWITFYHLVIGNNIVEFKSRKAIRFRNLSSLLVVVILVVVKWKWNVSSNTALISRRICKSWNSGCHILSKKWWCGYFFKCF